MGGGRVQAGGPDGGGLRVKRAAKAEVLLNDRTALIDGGAAWATLPVRTRSITGVGARNGLLRGTDLCDDEGRAEGQTSTGATPRPPGRATATAGGCQTAGLPTAPARAARARDAHVRLGPSCTPMHFPENAGMTLHSSADPQFPEMFAFLKVWVLQWEDICRSCLSEEPFPSAESTARFAN